MEDIKSYVKYRVTVSKALKKLELHKGQFFKDVWNSCISFMEIKMSTHAYRGVTDEPMDSDRGVQYAANDYIDRLKENEIRISMSRKGNPYEQSAIL